MGGERFSQGASQALSFINEQLSCVTEMYWVGTPLSRSLGHTQLGLFFFLIYLPGAVGNTGASRIAASIK